MTEMVVQENHTSESLVGRVVQIISSVVDVGFAGGQLPGIHEALTTSLKDGSPLVLEVQKHLGRNRVRCLAMGITDGLRLEELVSSSGEVISVPVGTATLGRIFNVLGEPIDGKGPVDAVSQLPIHRKAPEFIEQTTKIEVLETGLKVIDLIAPFTKGGKTGVFGGAGVGKTVII
jgi:F-type H+-transporting ATPase subunit beta